MKKHCVSGLWMAEIVVLEPNGLESVGKLVQGGTAVVKKFVASMAFVGMMAYPTLAAWPSFGSGSDETTNPPSSTSLTVPAQSGKTSESALKKLWPLKSASKPTPVAAPHYRSLGSSSETTTQKVKRVLNPAKWFGSSESKKVTEPDPLSLSADNKTPTPQLRVAMAQLAEAKGNSAEARKLMNLAVREAPRDATVLREYARMEDRAGRMAEAENLYRRAVSVSPQDPSFRNDLGLCLARSGKHRESAEMLSTAVGLNPQKALYRNNLATVLVELGDTGGAFAQLSTVHPPAVAHYNMGQLFSQRGRQAEAAECYRTALQVDPSLQQAQTALNRLQAGNFQVAARPAATPQTTPVASSQPTPAATIPVTPHPSFGAAAGPSFPVPRNLPPVE